MTQKQKETIHAVSSTIVRNILKMLWIFPVKENRVSFISHSGSQYSCNPKYISKYLGKHFPRKFDRVFVFRDPSRWEGDGERFDKFLSIKNLYDFCTSKVIVSNGGMPTYLPKREGQYIINTWHGGGAYKINKISGNMEDEKTQSRIALDLYKTKNTDLVLSSSKVFSDYVIPDIVPEYRGEIMPCGMPRNDIVYLENHAPVRQKICERLRIDPNRKIVLYAPTYRGSFDNTSIQTTEVFHVELDMKGMLDAISTRYGFEPILLIRAHYAMNMASYAEPTDIIDVSGYPDTQELLCATDILISDYSSIIWDFSLTKRPCFLYVPDMEYYMNEDRGTYTPIETWPGILCKSNEELQDAILNFDEQEYVKKVKKYHEDMGSYETGTACEQVCRRIAEVCGVE